jgi:hypothetical protein
MDHQVSYVFQRFYNAVSKQGTGDIYNGTCLAGASAAAKPLQV